MTYDVIIIGAGPAGLTAAIYTGRNRLKTLVLSKDLGGQAAVAGEVGNFPGIAKITGAELVRLMYEQATSLNFVEAKIGAGYSIVSLARGQDGYNITTQDGNKYGGQTVIITAGRDPKKLNIPGEKEFIGRGVSYCATCDAPFFKNRTVAVVGGGNSASKAADMLSRYATKIYVLTINEDLGGETVILEKIKSLDKITVVPFAHATQILNDKAKVTGIEYRDGKTGETQQVKVDGVLVEIGSVPNTQHFGGLVKLNQWNEIEIDNKNSSKMPGLFAAGDVTSILGKQIVIAAGEGAKAAMAVSEYLTTQKNKIDAK